MGTVTEAATCAVFFPNCLRGVCLKNGGGHGLRAMQELGRDLGLDQNYMRTPCVPGSP